MILEGNNEGTNGNGHRIKKKKPIDEGKTERKKNHWLDEKIQKRIFSVKGKVKQTSKVSLAKMRVSDIISDHKISHRGRKQNFHR